MSGGKGGGSSGLGDMVQYGNQALALQRDIYNETKGINAPYVQAGQAGINELLMRMGLSGQAANAPSNRQALIDQYKGQFTTQQGSGGNMYVGPDGRVYTLGEGDEGIKDFVNQYSRNNIRYSGGEARFDGIPSIGGLERALRNDGVSMSEIGFNPLSQKTSTTDNAGLNDYVDKLLASQAGKDQANPFYGSLLKSFGMEDYQADPGYQFRLNEGNKALERVMASRGQFTSMNPAAAKALQAYNQDLASQEYGAAYDRYNINQGNIYNRLANLAGMGQTAVGTQAGVGGNYANAGTDILTSMGNATAASKQASAANRGSMFNTLLGAGLSVGMAPTSGGGSLLGNWLSDRRLKTNIQRIGDSEGIPLYKFNYDPKNDYVRHLNLPVDKTYIGVMADDIEELYPEAVTEQDGYKRVNYALLGLDMQEVQ
jgi:hypothetical protein